MQQLAVFLFYLFLGCSFSIISSTTPVLATANGNGNNQEQGDGKLKQKPVVITNSKLTKADMLTMDQAFRDGRKVMLTDAIGNRWNLDISYWNRFMRYEPKMARIDLNSINNYDVLDAGSVKTRIRVLKKLLKKLKIKVKLAKKFGTPTQVKIVDWEVVVIETELENTVDDFKRVVR